MTAIDVGTIASPGVILDRRTQDELQPPCDSKIHDVTAEWALRFACTGCEQPFLALVCAMHLAKWLPIVSAATPIQRSQCCTELPSLISVVRL